MAFLDLLFDGLELNTLDPPDPLELPGLDQPPPEPLLLLDPLNPLDPPELPGLDQPPPEYEPPLLLPLLLLPVRDEKNALVLIL